MARTGTVLDEMRTIFSVFMTPSGLIKSTGESVFQTTLYMDGVPSDEAITITEIEASGDYLATFTPIQSGYWYLQILDSKGGIHVADFDITGDISKIGTGSNTVHLQILTPTASLGTHIKVRKSDRTAVATAMTDGNGNAYIYLNPGNYLFEIFREDGLIWTQTLRRVVPDAEASEFDDLATW